MVFLDAQEGRYVEELGGMNMYFVYADGRIVTPETGTILEGITRRSIIELAGKLGYQVEERRISDRRVARRGHQRRDQRGLRVRHRRGGHPRRVAALGRRPDPGGRGRRRGDDADPQALVDIQFGRAEDTHAWLHRVC